MPRDIEPAALPLVEVRSSGEDRGDEAARGDHRGTARDVSSRPPGSRDDRGPTASPRQVGAARAASDDLRDLAAGLDRLQTETDQPRSRWRKAADSVIPPIVFLVLAIAAWQAFVWIAKPRPDKVPSPLDVVNAIGYAWSTGQLPNAVTTSLERGLVGFLIAIVIGTPLGLLLAEVPFVRRAVGPIISGLQVLPSVAWVPAAILWFGLTDATVYFVVLMGATPSVINGLVAGVDQVPPQLRRVGTVLGASKFELATIVVLPAALPGYIAGLKQGWAFSWRSLMAAEIIAYGGTIGFGLGAMLQNSRSLADIAGVFVTVLTILAIGIVIELCIFNPVERRVLRGRGLLGASR